MKSNNKLKRLLRCAGVTLSSILIPAFVAAQDQCNTTQQCRVEFGPSATDCRDSRSNNSICMCGSERCDIQASPELPSFRFDFGTSDSPRQAGYLRITSSSLSGPSRWTDGSGLRPVDRNKSTQLNRDFVYSRHARTFRVSSIPNGSYRVTVTLGDTYSHDNMVIKAEGQTKVSDIDRGANEWRDETFDVNVSDGNLDLEFSDAGGSDPNWVVNAVVIEGASSAPAPTPAPVPTSPPVAGSKNTIIAIEAESVSPVGHWKRHSYIETTPATERRRTGLLFDPPKSFLNGADRGQTLVYNFKSKEAASYRLSLLMARDKTKFSKDDPGGSGNWGDQRNNDVYVKLIEARTNKTIYGPTRLFFGGRKDLNDRMVWGNMYDKKNGGKDGWKSASIAKHNLKANTDYKLEISGRGDGVIIDYISLTSEKHLSDTSAHRRTNRRDLPKLPSPSISNTDLNQYPAMEIWSKAGVEGGIPKNLPIKKRIGSGDNIQNAVNDVAKAGGGVVLLRNGIYRLNGKNGIKMANKVVIRGESRDGVRIESRLTAGAGFTFDKVQYSGVENLTYNFEYGGKPPRHDWYGNTDGNSRINSFHITSGTKNNWVKNCNIINSGQDPISVAGSHNTFTGNYVDGSYNKSGGKGYYRIAFGSHNLVKGETMKNLRHIGVLTRRAAYNVIVDNFIETDVNFHTGDVGHNLVEGNSVYLPKHHGWGLFGTGLPRFSHMTPGDGNLVVNNLTRHDKNNHSIISQKDVVFMFQGYGDPVPTNIKVPEGGRFYVPAWGDVVQKQISFVNPTPRDKAILGVGSNLEVTVEGQGDIQSIALYRDNTFVREELQEPYEWSGNKDALLQNLAEGKYEFRAEATFADGARANKSFMVTVGDSTQLSKRIQAEDFDAQSGIQNVLGKKVGYVNNGDWIRFNGLSIAQASSFSVNVATPTQGGTIEIRSGSLQGPLLGSVDVSNTFGWDKFVSLQTNVASVYTSTDIFLVFKGSGNGYLFDIDYFQFD